MHFQIYSHRFYIHLICFSSSLILSFFLFLFLFLFFKYSIPYYTYRVYYKPNANFIYTFEFISILFVLFFFFIKFRTVLFSIAALICTVYLVSFFDALFSSPIFVYKSKRFFFFLLFFCWTNNIHQYKISTISFCILHFFFLMHPYVFLHMCVIVRVFVWIVFFFCLKKMYPPFNRFIHRCFVRIL